MMKCAVVLFSVVCLAQSQRPPYAGSSNRYPVVLPQFVEQEKPDANVANRLGENDGNNDTQLSSSSSVTPMSSTSSTIPPNIPVDALGDIDLINRIKTWPKEKQPFWFLNWQAIQEHRGDVKNRAQPAATQPNTKSFFAG